MPRYLLEHHRSGAHAIWWTLDTDSQQEALALLPRHVAERTTVSGVSEAEIP